MKTGDAKSFTPETGMTRQVLAHSEELMLVRHFLRRDGWGLGIVIRIISWFMW